MAMRRCQSLLELSMAPLESASTRVRLNFCPYTPILHSTPICATRVKIVAPSFESAYPTL